MNRLPVLDKGWVWLAGAGPGDPGLISLLTLRGLQQADVIVYDALVSQEILDMAHEAAVLEYAGKRGGRPSAKQSDISERLVELARAGKKVLRLKGGDPLVFGRGGEEARYLVSHGIPFRIIPGITAGVGGLAYAGIPLTDRHTNSAVTFLTGHGADGGLAKDIDWDALAKASPVVVIYMALSRVGLIAQQFLKSGRPAEEPVAVISRATTSDQVVLETTLGRCEDDLKKAKIEAPAMIVVGEVVKLRAGLDWLGALGGKKLSADVSSVRPQGERKMDFDHEG
ncbi:uroporphyrinogen-III C-methyltransferase [Luteithermobacter gelatinilyticus]|uniref:uroporphyrinogen-III C-methyltransferase n=1 Tax=Luteithermobacter gelatinilyticus TaxID=2582913 RepID=UPI001AEFEA1E|nr:uroporphyrinogen-III C-methyltransferase [Luteithermobacter gelatinilyticus]